MALVSAMTEDTEARVSQTWKPPGPPSIACLSAIPSWLLRWLEPGNNEFYSLGPLRGPRSKGAGWYGFFWSTSAPAQSPGEFRQKIISHYSLLGGIETMRTKAQKNGVKAENALCDTTGRDARCKLLRERCLIMQNNKRTSCLKCRHYGYHWLCLVIPRTQKLFQLVTGVYAGHKRGPEM